MAAPVVVATVEKKARRDSWPADDMCSVLERDLVPGMLELKAAHSPTAQRLTTTERNRDNIIARRNRYRMGNESDHGTALSFMDTVWIRANRADDSMKINQESCQKDRINDLSSDALFCVSSEVSLSLRVRFTVWILRTHAKDSRCDLRTVSRKDYEKGYKETEDYEYGVRLRGTGTSSLS